MDASKYRPRGYSMSSDKRLPYLLMLLLAIGAAMLGVGVLHKMRERRVFSILLQEREQQLVSLQVVLENEKEISREMRRKVDELQAKTSILSIERTELKNKVMDSETTQKYLTNTQQELEAALVEKEGHINQMKQIAAASGPDQMAAIKELLQQKEAELEDIKTKFQGYKNPDTKASSSSNLLGTNNENATPDTAVLQNSGNSGDSMPTPTEESRSYDTTAPQSNHQDESIVEGQNIDVTPDTVITDEKADSSDSLPAPEQLHSYNTTASEGNYQDKRTVMGTTNDDVTPDRVILDEKEDSTTSIPAPAEELHSYNTTASESNHIEDSSSEEHFTKFTTNFEDDVVQEKTGDATQDPDDTPEGSHSEKSEVHQFADSQEVSKEQQYGKKELEEPQGEVSYRSRESKLLEKEDIKEVASEPEKEISPEGESKISQNSLSDANPDMTQAVEPAAGAADVKPSMITNNGETKEASKRHRKRKSRSKRRKRTDVAASNMDGEPIKGR